MTTWGSQEMRRVDALCNELWPFLAPGRHDEIKRLRIIQPGQQVRATTVKWLNIEYYAAQQAYRAANKKTKADKWAERND